MQKGINEINYQTTKISVLKFGSTSISTPQAVQAVGEIILSKAQKGPIVVVFSAPTEMSYKLYSAGKVAISLPEPSCASNKSALNSEALNKANALIDATQDSIIKLASAVIPPVRLARTLAVIYSTFRTVKEQLFAINSLGELTTRALDLLKSAGESLSTEIMVAYFNEALANEIEVNNFFAQSLDARSLIFTDSKRGINEQVTAKNCQDKILPLLSDNFLANNSVLSNKAHRRLIPFIQGSIASSSNGPDGDPTPLGADGSDLTAAIITAALDAAILEIWTDVDGILTADPKKVNKVFALPHLSYAEALEFSHFGAKTIYAPNLRPVMTKNIPIIVKNTFNPNAPGTLINSSSFNDFGDSADSREVDKKFLSESSKARFPITGISSIDDVSMIRLQGTGLVGASGLAARVFEALARTYINVILITQGSSETTICFAILPTDTEKAKDALITEFNLEINAGLMESPIIESSLAIISIVGSGMRRRPGIAGTFFSALGRNGVNSIAIAQGSSELSISVVINKADEEKALRVAHDEFFVQRTTRTLHVAIVGTGLVGTTLLKQISSHLRSLRDERRIEIKLVAIARSKEMLIDSEGIIPERWTAILEERSEPLNFEVFINKLGALNLANSICVDCTSSDDVAESYGKLLSRHIAIVTPNKRAQSGSLEKYNSIKNISEANHVPFLFETSVGAGLPVISTLQDLIKSGDRILRIEGVLSGTLGYLCTQLMQDVPFSKAVHEAKRKGYTEPDPRDDLCGMDVGRKILILARESGYSLELSEVEIESLVPQECSDSDSISHFMEELPRADERMRATVMAAKQRGGRLCYIASFSPEEGAKTKLTVIYPDHPFSHIRGSDNIIAFTTDRYQERPLIVQGPGAGAEVTAAGVFADIVRIAQMGSLGLRAL